MGNKSSGKTYTSAGVHSNVSSKTRNAMKNARSEQEKIQNVQTAWYQGRNPWVVIDNPNREETNKRKIRVRSNEQWGSSKEHAKKTFIMK